MSERFEKITAIRGMNDLLPQASGSWEYLEQQVRAWLASYGYTNIRTPIVESTRLFTRGIGEVTDIVEKEMYTFTDHLNGDSLTLRPEFTAGVVRAAIEHNLIYDGPKRVFSIGPVFRHERPQRGRYRQFHQIDVEALGFSGPDIDIEMILMTARLWRRLGLDQDMRLEVNSLGTPQERLKHREALISYLEGHLDILDDDSKRRLYSNPLRVLDTKNPALQSMAVTAPAMLQFLGQESKEHFDALCKTLDDHKIPYHINPRLVRGLDYYNLTVFEWVTDKLGAQATVCGGGRYDGLIALLGGTPAPAIGFAIGFERLLDLWQQTQKHNHVLGQPQIYILHQGEQAQQLSLNLAESLRDHNLNIVLHCGGGSFKSQMKKADASGAFCAIIIGEDEVASGLATVKFLRNETRTQATEHSLSELKQTNDSQQKIKFESLADWLKTIFSTPQ